jgi:hypothetical protein
VVAARLGLWRGEEVAAGKEGEDEGGFNKGSSPRRRAEDGRRGE